MKQIRLSMMRLIIAAFMLGSLITLQTPAAPGNLDLFFGNESDKLPTKFNFAGANFNVANAPFVNVANVEELYAAVNNSANAGKQIVLAAGIYTLTATNAASVARPNGGRLELQENMSLRGVFGDRGAAVIDAINLPLSSFSNSPPVTLTGAIRMGKGFNSIEWLTVRNAVNGGAGIIAHLSAPGTAYVRIAHIVSTGNFRGIDVRNVGGGATSTAGYVINAEIVDNDLYNNKIKIGEGLRLANVQGGSGNVVSAFLGGNRSYGNNFGLLVENTGSTNFGNITIFSVGDRFYENASGTFISGAIGTANNNTVNFTATGSAFENNNGTSIYDKSGLLLVGGENSVVPNGVSNNTVNVGLLYCRFGNNQQSDLSAFGARSTPVSIGLPGTNNLVKIKLYATPIPNLAPPTDSNPAYPGGMNSVSLSTIW